MKIESPTNAAVEYVRAYPASAEGPNHQTGSVTHRYTITPH